MILAEVSPTLVDIGTYAAIIVGVLAACAAVSRLAVVKWLWKRIIGDPVTAWLERVVRGVTDPIAADVAKVTTAFTAHMQAEERRAETDAADRDARQAAADEREERFATSLAEWQEETRDEINGLFANQKAQRQDLEEIKATMITKPPPR